MGENHISIIRQEEIYTITDTNLHGMRVPDKDSEVYSGRLIALFTLLSSNTERSVIV